MTEGFAASRATLFVELTPLLADRWSDDARAVAGIAGVLRGRLPGQVAFFHGGRRVAAEAAGEALRRGAGGWLCREVETGRADSGPLPLLDRRVLSVGLRAGGCGPRRAFDIEARLVADLAPLMVPGGATAGAAARLVEDVASADVLIAASDAVRHDLIAVLDVAEGRVAVARGGIGWSEAWALAAANVPEVVEPFLLVPGPGRPGDGWGVVLAMLGAHPEILETHRVVFCGQAPRGTAVKAGRVVWAGAVAGEARAGLLAGAVASLHPAPLDGTGMPVIESLAAGTPAVCAWSAAPAELGGELCATFDPLSAEGLHEAVRGMIGRVGREGAALAAACRARAAGFMAAAAADSVLEAIERAMLRRARAA